MNKNLLVLTALATASAATFAQSTVTLYGIVDAGVSSVSGLRGGRVNQVVSGIMEGSRLGIRFSEDLGGGWRAIGTLESRLESDTGALSNRPASGSQLPDRIAQAPLLGLPTTLQPVVSAVGASIGASVGVNVAGNFWDRQIYAGLVTPVGAVVAGRMYTPAYEISATFDTLGTQSGLAFGQVAAIPASVDIRLSNAVQYRVELNGFTAALMVAAGEGSTTTGRFIGGMGMYKGEAFSVGAAYNTRENELGQKSLTNAIIGANVVLGPGRLYAAVATAKDDNPTGLSGIAATITPLVGAPTAAFVQGAFVNGFKQDSRLAHIGYKLEMGPNTVYIAYSKNDDKRLADADTQSYGVAYSYALSKRTDLNAVVVRFDNSGLGQAAPGGQGYLGGVTASAGTDSTGVALGIRHRF